MTKLDDGIHFVPEVGYEPIIEMKLVGIADCSWSDELPTLPDTTRHLVGWDVKHCEGRVSSPIVGVMVTKDGLTHYTTHSGRVYLISNEEASLDETKEAVYIFKGFMRANAEYLIEGKL